MMPGMYNLDESRCRFSLNYAGNFQPFQFLNIFILKVASGAPDPFYLTLLFMQYPQGIFWK
ncbi:hypothetical protein [Methanosarcina siciliae]|uniref:hypothetical protein n=1 Tax=Methanosarcina siciliae TaxID=38027 RepID=UPI000A9D1676|nr:hypothetical protein [Methanosarcina siciliae]